MSWFPILINDISGNLLIDNLNSASANLGISDIRHLQKNSPNLLDQMLHFHTAAQTLTADKGLKVGFFLRKIEENRQTLLGLLNKPWNSELKVEETAVTKNDPPTLRGSEYYFRIATPLKEKSSFSCDDCEYTVTNHVVFKRHVKKKHNKVTKVTVPKVTCMLPHPQRGTRVSNQHTMDQIGTHLKLVGIYELNYFFYSMIIIQLYFQVHRIDKPSPAHTFRGFETLDKGQTYKPVFRLPDEPNPVSLCSEDAFTTSVKKNLFKDPGQGTEKEDDKGESVPILPTTSGKTEDYFANDDKRGGSSEEYKGSQQTEKSDPDNNTKSEEEDDKGGSVPIRQTTSGKAEDYSANNDKRGGGSEEFEASQQTEESDPENKKKSDPEPEPEKEKNSYAFKEVEDEVVGSYERRLADSITQSSWAHDLEDDSDIEEGDEDDFTFIRLRNKMDRYEKRNTPDKVLLAELPVNKKVINSFITYLKKTSTTQNPNNPTINLSTSLLFRHGDCLLEFMFEKDSSFSLDRLLCFNDVGRFKELKKLD